VRWRRPLIGPFSALQVAAVLVAVTLTALLLVAINTPIAGTAAPSVPVPGASFVLVGDPVDGLRVGDRAPELTGTANGDPIQLADLDGNPITLADLRGRPVWINFWASWCPPCQYETPVLRDTYEAHADEGLALVAISVQETTAADIRAYAERYGLGYTIGFDPTGAIFKAYQAYALPTQVFIDRDGIVRNVVLGPVSRDQAEEILAPLLAG
jgi:cytochrome c biogenesis protein CcmG/thiol:disulfide interchange protein DsbE